MRVLINRTDAIGDTLLTLPMAKLIKEKYPDAEVIFWVSSKTQDIYKYYPWVDEIWVMDQGVFWFNRLIHSFKKLFKIKIDAYFFVGGSHFPSFCAWLKRIKFRGGLKSKWQSFIFLNKSVRQKRSLVEMHESDYNLLLLDKFGINYNFKERQKYRPMLEIPAETVKETKDDFLKSVKDVGVDCKNEFILIHPGMIGHTLNWSMHNYARLILKIDEFWPDKFFFVISYTQFDMKYINKIKIFLKEDYYSHLKNKIFYYDGGIKGLDTYMKIMKNASLFVGPSTGTTHLANCLDIPQVGIYSPIKVQSAMRWGPFARSEDKCHIVVPDVVCGEQFTCAGEDCSYYNCMAKIEVDDILGRIKRLLIEV